MNYKTRKIMMNLLLPFYYFSSFIGRIIYYPSKLLMALAHLLMWDWHTAKEMILGINEIEVDIKDSF